MYVKVSFAFSNGLPDCDPEQSIKNIISLGATVSGVTLLGGTSIIVKYPALSAFDFL
jgi:hypothetical protein